MIEKKECFKNNARLKCRNSYENGSTIMKNKLKVARKY